MARSQLSIEFLITSAIVIVFILVLFTVLMMYSQIEQSRVMTRELYALRNNIKNEFIGAEVSHYGYSHIFYLPQTIGLRNYTIYSYGDKGAIKIDDGKTESIILVPVFEGNLCKGYNRIIRKENISVECIS